MVFYPFETLKHDARHLGVPNLNPCINRILVRAVSDSRPSSPHSLSPIQSGRELPVLLGLDSVISTSPSVPAVSRSTQPSVPVSPKLTVESAEYGLAGATLVTDDGAATVRIAA